MTVEDKNERESDNERKKKRREVETVRKIDKDGEKNGEEVCYLSEEQPDSVTELSKPQDNNTSPRYLQRGNKD